MNQNDRKITIVLDRLRSAYNTGNIFRIADAVGASEIITCGYTPSPPHQKLAKTAMGAENYVKYRHLETSVEAVIKLKEEGYREILSVESGCAGKYPWEHQFKFPLALIFGNEALGIDPVTLKHCDGNIFLPMLGEKTSINVGNCAATVLYFVLSSIISKKNI